MLINANLRQTHRGKKRKTQLALESKFLLWIFQPRFFPAWPINQGHVRAR